MDVQNQGPNSAPFKSTIKQNKPSFKSASLIAPFYCHTLFFYNKSWSILNFIFTEILSNSFVKIKSRVLHTI